MGAVAHTAVPHLLRDNAEVLDEIIRDRTVRALYQPIVELDTGRVIAWDSA
jgi:sensor c-di-GMP phosphodiesterase-like protein